MSQGALFDPRTRGSAPPAEAPAEAPPEATLERVVVALEDGGVLVSAPAFHPLRERLRDLPGAAWTSTGAWRFPLTRRCALALRGALTGQRPEIDEAARAALREAADSEPVPDVVLAGERVEVRFEHTAALQDDVKRRTAATWDGAAQCWRASLDRVEDVIAFAEAHGLLVHPDVRAAAAARYAPFDYDGTIDGLRGVPVQELHAVRAQRARGRTPSLAARLAETGVRSVYDLLMLVPRRYLDRSTATPVRGLRDLVGTDAGLIATISRIGQYDRTRRLVRVAVADGTGTLEVTFFQAPWIPHRFRVGDEVSLWGRVDLWTGRGGRGQVQMTNPVMDRLGGDTALVVPVYPQSAKAQVSTWDLHGAAMEAARRLGDLADPLPGDVRERHDLLARREAYQQVHRPDSVEAAGRARERLAFDELLRMQLALGLRRHATAAETGVAHRPSGALTGQLLAQLPFALTGAQQRALAQITADLTRPHPMHRLLQGDVGSGKTLVAATVLLAAVEGGYQGALMAPTEILATQLHRELASRLLAVQHPDGRPLVVELLASKTKAADRRRILAGLADGSTDLVVGTHALLTQGVDFADLGVVVVDEQHRFGVEQRATLRAKGRSGVPDTLVMTATPIPRTAALTVFGDLDVSVLDELPPGRTPIATSWLPETLDLDDADAGPWRLVREQVGAGRQAYVVASLVEDNEKIAAQSATEAHEALQHGALAGLRVGLVHGRQDRTEREATMAAFAVGELDVLVATTVIEVGVDVPNATVMVVLDAPRFGIAQLHQIRGRVGRGRHASTCVLTGRAGSADAVARMHALVGSTDGFHLSEVDLDLRGAGSVFGARQSGESDLRVADLRRDLPLVLTAREEATALLDADPTLARRPGLRAEVHTALGPELAAWLAKS
ncbi:ATP-dependent DNA helicase RecG [Quadrisphaera sp. DSM 44207]|uniref:ATP-dependent DNA helicase RecG n=1 Tax=Quadrisphaera sp. DSM 44207 TaxID=1881057 RepID=UPI00088C397D|nr:ATP-dependent DNA helicase RecG [Quadrisphaera sp. DSM 44207]SDQ04376.1 ATP-dependent DNA helicase RecG [Quadrisphaera sp. DSM 44207]